MSSTTGLTVRQHERDNIELSVEFVVCEKDREQVQFSPMSTAAEPHSTCGRAVDISPGGLGLICQQFVPRMCEGSVRVFDPKPVGTARDGSPIYEVTFEHPVKVRRVSLASHEPTYALGVAFIDPEPDLEQRVNKLLMLVGAGENRSGEAEGEAHA